MARQTQKNSAVIIGVRMTKDEKAKLSLKAKKHNISLSSYVRLKLGLSDYEA